MTSGIGQSSEAAGREDAPYMIISADDHAGPRPSRFLRQYCPQKYLEQFDDFCRQQDETSAQQDELIAAARARIAGSPQTATVKDLSYDLHGKCRDCEGHHDPHVRLRDMDADGIAAQVIFAGGQNGTDLPWSGLAWNAGPSDSPADMRAAAYHMWNQWLAEFISVAPERFAGVMQIPIWDLDAARREVEWCANAGLRVVNLPAPREDYRPYTDLAYEPFWALCEEVGATLATHAGASSPYGDDVRKVSLLRAAEFHWFGNRGLPQLIFGGVFERYPGLKFVLTEQRIDFAPMMVKHLDSIYDNISATTQEARKEIQGGILTQVNILFGPDEHDLVTDPDEPDALPHRPSEYWRDHCYLSGSFLAPFEVALRHEVGLGNLMWGADYPHSEGTWPDTRISLRHTFAGLPVDEVRTILGETAIGVYHFDREALRKVADRIGPRPADIDVPLAPEDIPLERNWAFRQAGNFS
jgi:predicted TIM-barrel fold metal-dependent hydrolase